MFTNSYRRARAQFIRLANYRNASLFSIPHPLMGAEGECLASDIAVLGDSPYAIMTASATHGVEGFYGSAVQSMLLTDPRFQRKDIRYIHYHAVNPWGFSHLRRVNENNVDINRNFWQKPPTQYNKHYSSVRDWICPDSLSKTAMRKSEDAYHKLRNNKTIEQLKIAVFGGQTIDPLGIQFAGLGHTWSRLCFEKSLATYLQGVTKLIFCDLHTGLGPPGYPDLLSTYPPESPQQKQMKSLFGAIADLDTKNEATGQRVTNETNSAVDLFSLKNKNLSALSLALECGTVSLESMLHALRLEHAGWLGGGTKKEISTSKQLLKDAFYINNPAWKKNALQQSAEHFIAFQQVVAEL